MKSKLLIAVTLFLMSCAVEKKTLVTDIQLSDSLQLVQSTQDTIVESDSVKIVLESFVTNEMKYIKKDDIRKFTEPEQRVAIKKHENKTDLTVIDRSTNNLDTTLGLIAYSIPEVMKVAKSYTIKVRISKKSGQTNKAVLILGQDDAINNSEWKSIANIEDCRVSGEMSAELRASSDHFTIVNLSTPIQNIDTLSYTEWEWVVTPKTSGQTPIKLVIKLKDLNKDIVVFNKNVVIKTNVNVVVESFFDKHWQWLMTTIIIPIFIYFWNRKKKKRENQ